MPPNETAISPGAIRSVLASHALALRAVAIEIDDPEFSGNGFAATRIIGHLRKISVDLDALRDDVLALCSGELRSPTRKENS